ncbi:unnamed protein product [Paramecium primaurelia]|uniref:Serine carboxypeptidase S28 family protein n=1 Tax=Paramecium primaurelia TaxID=5886 RepID=A0A8S1PMY3_PARPR|nr:unnamed protein product [Paramecium primaurelia]
MNQITLILLISIFGVNGYIQTERWFEQQLIDHYDRTNKQTFRQRYWTVEEYFQPEGGAILFWICGEYTCPGIRKERLFPVELAQTHKALIVVLEHRFYGKSMPFEKDALKIENLKYLGIRQALDDLAYFQLYIVQNKLFGVKQSNPWIAIGGSYPGAMAAWYRYQYPHLVVGALASSAVIQILTDFPKFDTQVYQSALKSGQECADNLKALNQYAEDNLETIRRRLNAEKLTEDEFLFYFTDAIILKVQYGGRSRLCNDLKGKTINEQMDYFIERALIEDNPQSYGSYYLKDDVYDENNLRSSRQWMYQCCTEVGWWQIAPDQNSLRSNRLDIEFYKQHCKNIFGEELKLWPDEDKGNAYFGGFDLSIDNIIFTNGDEDPWKWVSIIEQQGNMNVYHINCTDAGHCVELYTPTDQDCDQLKQARIEISQIFGNWIRDHYSKQEL